MRTSLRLLLASITLLAITACSDGSDGTFGVATLSGCADTNSCAANPTLEIGGERPARVWIPSDYDPGTQYPLLVVLHGFGATGLVQSIYMGFPERVDPFQFVMVAPDGTLSEDGDRFWNATAACCGGPQDERNVDDVAYISGLIREAAQTYSIDATRVALFGHSNGGFMALRMACEASEIVTTVVNLAGSTFESEEQCAPATFPVSVMGLHGTLDETIPYDGSTIPGFAFPSAPESARRFAVLAGCDTNNTSEESAVDMDGSLAGAETDRLIYNDCIRGADVELWTINGGPHIPIPWASEGTDLLVDWLLTHPRNP